MEDKYNDNLGDFFRKKISDPGPSDESWERPDEKVRIDLLNKISSPVHPPLYSSNLFWKIATVIALLLVGGYIYYLHQKNSEIKNVLQAQSTQLKKVETELLNTKNKAIENTSTLIFEKEKAVTDRQNILSQRKELIETIKLEKSTAVQLSIENEKLKKQIRLSSVTDQSNEKETEDTETALSTETNEKRAKVSAVEIVQKIYPIVLQQYLSQEIMQEKSVELETAAEKMELEIVEEIEPIKPKSSKYEVGYEYALTGFEIPIERKFALQRAANQNVQSNKVNINFHGATFAYALKNNLWIRTGFRKATFNLEREYKIALDYNKQNETDRPGQGTSNQLLLTTSTPYTTTRSTFEITFDEGEELKEGDLLELTIADVQKLNYIQIPIGLEYHYGSEKLKGIIQGGILWNSVTIEEYTFTVFSKAKEKEIPIDRRRVIAKDIPSDKFFSTYVGLGLDYQLFNHFHARASFNLNHNLIKNNNRIERFSNSAKTGTALSLGLNYRF